MTRSDVRAKEGRYQFFLSRQDCIPTIRENKEFRTKEVQGRFVAGALIALQRVEHYRSNLR